MNSVILVGRLTKDPEMAYTQSQTARTTFTIAVDRPRRNGEDQGADFIRVVVWGKQAENCDRYIRKGRQVAVKGSIRTGSYENSSGTRVYTTDVWAENVEFLGNKNDDSPRKGETFEPAKVDTSALYGSFDDMPDTFSSAEDDIPF